MRLTKTVVEDVARKVIKHRFSADVLALRCAEAQLFNEAWKALYTPAEQKFLLGAPEGFVCTTSTIDTNIGGQRHVLAARGSAYGAMAFAMTEADLAKIVLLPDRARCAVRHERGMRDDKMRFAAGDDGLPEAITALAAKKDDLTKTIADAEAKITAALNGTTRAKAIALWPEIEPFLPVENKPAGLPALPTKELNALLDLPVSEAA